MKNTLYITAILITGIMVTACSGLEETGCEYCGETHETSVWPYGVSFSLVGYADPVTRVTQTGEEKKINSLYAVVFEDSDAGDFENGETGKESDEDLFVAAIPIDLDGYNNAIVPNLSFSVGKEGKFNICFVANPSTELKEKIEALTTTGKVSDFKALKETNPPDLASSFLMTSQFYAVTTAYAKTATIGTVSMTRTVARIDILNKADGIRVDKLTFYNYASKTRLISDTPQTFDADCITPEKEFTIDGGLPGNSQSDIEGGNNYFGQKIYTYEQFSCSYPENEISGGYRPTIEVEYTITSSDEKYSHTVKFYNSSDEEVPLRRNTHYLVTLTNQKGTMNFSISVKDWEDGTVFNPAGSDFANGTIQP